jgi:hypothetical protein
MSSHDSTLHASWLKMARSPYVTRVKEFMINLHSLGIYKIKSLYVPYNDVKYNRYSLDAQRCVAHLLEFEGNLRNEKCVPRQGVLSVRHHLSLIVLECEAKRHIDTLLISGSCIQDIGTAILFLRLPLSGLQHIVPACWLIDSPRQVIRKQ